MNISVEEVQIIISLLDKNIEDKDSLIEDLQQIFSVNKEKRDKNEWKIQQVKKRMDEMCILRTKLNEAKIVI